MNRKRIVSALLLATLVSSSVPVRAEGTPAVGLNSVEENNSIESVENTTEEVKSLNKEELNKAIELAESLDEADYTSISWKNLQNALQSAKEVQSYDSSQEAIDYVTTWLNNTINALKEEVKTELDKVIEKAESLNEAFYTEISWASLQNALRNAKEVQGSETSQEAVDFSIDWLNNTINALEDKFDREELNKAIEKAETLEAALYTDESWASLQNALKNAKEAQNSTSQGEIDHVTTWLNNTINALVEVETLKANGIGEIVAPDEVNLLNVGQFNLELGEDVEAVNVTYFWNENGVEKKYSDSYEVKEAGELTIDRLFKFARLYRVEYTPVVDNQPQVEESKSINLKVINTENYEIVSVTGNEDTDSTNIENVGDVVTFKVETGLDVDRLKFNFETSNNYVEYYSKNINAEEVDGKLVWTIKRSIKTIEDKHKIMISTLKGSEVKDSTYFEVTIGE